MKRPRLLVVDADAATTAAIAECLDGIGDLVSVKTGEDALEAFVSRRPDLVILDHKLPGLDGYATCRALRKLAGAPGLPILVLFPVATLTGTRDAEVVQHAFDAGASDIVVQPISPALLKHRVRRLLTAAEASAASNASAQRLSVAHRLARLAQWQLDLRSGAFTVDEESFDVLGIPRSHGVERTSLTRWVHTDDRERVERALMEPVPHDIDYRLVLPDGTHRHIHQEAEIVVDERSGSARLLGAALDVTHLRRAEQQAVELAYSDPLTGLPNRAFVRRYLTRALGDAERESRPVAVLSLDLDFFKRVNDTRGHEVGDELLRQVSARLKACLRGGDLFGMDRDTEATLEEAFTANYVAGRVGGDEFVVVLGAIHKAEDAAVLAGRIADWLETPFALAEGEVFVSASIGIALYPENGRTSNELLDCADAATNFAKENGRNGFRFFTPAIQERARKRLEIESALRAGLQRSGILALIPTSDGRRTMAPPTLGPPPRATAPYIKKSEFTLHYQPKVDLHSGRVTGTEALLRWTSPERGAVPPSEFIPIAEDTGLIVSLGEWALRQACRTAQGWAQLGRPLTMAVNVSARQFREPDFAQLVRRVISETGLAPHLLELELTESVLMEHVGTSDATLASLKDLGVRIALDDFGTGYSSLGYLTRLRLDALKIDRSFVKEIGAEKRAETIIAAIISLARSLDMEIIVEGVETKEQLEFFRPHGSASVQGFLFAKPMPDGDVMAFCDEHEKKPRVSFRPTERTSARPVDGRGIPRASWPIASIRTAARR